MTEYEQILVERDGPVVLVWLNRPERQNAWTWKMSTELNDVLISGFELENLAAGIAQAKHGWGLTLGSRIT
jgi:1,4-dihydroxy-2-naphthoyl-CoA synthase